MDNIFNIYTDGSCDNIRYPNYGGWAYVILDNNNIIESKSGNESHTTNNRMEMIAIINAISSLPDFSNATIFTDSKYCIGAFSNQYYARANTDLIKQFFDVVESKNLNISFEWVRGHDGNKWNEMVDKMANDEFEKASGCKITDFKRIKYDTAYKREVFKNCKEDVRNKLIAEILIDVASSKTVNDKYIIDKVKEINKLFKLN